MKPTETFCEACQKQVAYQVEEVETDAMVKGKKYTYRKIVARCTECGSFVFVHDLNDKNLEILYDVVRQENQLVPLSTVCLIPEKYNIGKRPLSLLLGWGEQTYTRFLEGDLPSRQYSDMLTRLAEDPGYYLEILEKNRDRITEVAYKKSKKAAEALLLPPAKSGEIYQAIQYLLTQCEDITPLALQKALYYVQGFYYAFFGTFLFKEECQAWAHGPVYKDVYEQYKNYKFNPIAKPVQTENLHLSEKEKLVLDSVSQYFCCYSGKILEQFTHAEMPWSETRKDLSEGEPSERIIKKKLIGNYFTEVKETYQMEIPQDMKNYAREMFSRVSQ